MSEDRTDAESAPESYEGDLPDLASVYPELASALAAQPAPAMPEEVWHRLSSALADETPLVSTDPTVTALATQRTRRQRRALPLLGAAAGLALIGVVGVPLVMGGAASSPPVADSQVTQPVAEPTGDEPVVRSSDAPSQPESPAPTVVASSDPTQAAPAPSDPTDDPITAPADSGEVMAVPARLVLSTGTDYSPDAMTPQVTNLLTTAGFTDASGMADEVMTMQAADPPGLPPLVGSAGFTSDLDALRDCVGRLHAAKGGNEAGLAMPALLVDRAQFRGNDAGVVVMLHTALEGAPYLDVAVVGPECTDDDVARATWFRYDLP